FQRSGRAGLGVIFEHLAPAGDTGVSRDLDEDPGILEHEGLDLGDLNLLLLSNSCGVPAPGQYRSIEAEQRRGTEHAAQPATTIYLRKRHTIPPIQNRNPA